MADSKITDLPSASTPLSGTEVVYLVQSGSDVKATVQSIANLSGGGGTWGSITGTLSAQTDLQSALNAKAPINSPTFTGTVAGITAAMVGAPSGTGTCSGTNTGDQTNVTGNAGTVTTINGRISAGSGISLSGSGTAASPYVIANSIANMESGSNLFIPTPVVSTIIVIAYAVRPITLNQFHLLKTSSGSLTLTVKINGTAVTGLNAINVGTTPQSPTATAANVLSIGDSLSYEITSIVNPENLSGTLRMTTSY